MTYDDKQGRQDCERTEILLTAYAAGDLAPDGCVEVERHLAVCRDCRGELARERTLRDALASMPLIPCPAPVTERIMAVVDADEACETAALRRAKSDRWRRAGVGLVAAAAVLALLVFAPTGDRPADPVAGLGDQTWSDDEIRTARGELRYTLALAARIIEKSEKSTISEVFGRQLPGVVTKSVKAVTSSLEGGQG
jgi:anti-sigma factor RsiW